MLPTGATSTVHIYPQIGLQDVDVHRLCKQEKMYVMQCFVNCAGKTTM
jgi:hypothetical protein